MCANDEVIRHGGCNKMAQRVSDYVNAGKH